MTPVGVAMVLLGAVIVVGCLLLVVMEFRRYRRDRVPQPPLDPEVAALDRWHNGITVAIAALSVLGAILAWQASNRFDDAADLSRQAVDESVRYQAIRALSDGRIDFDARLSLIYQEHLRRETSLTTRATELRDAGDPAHAGVLEAEARVEGAIARVIGASFTTYAPTFNDDGTVVFDREEKAALARSDDSDLRTLDPVNVRAVEHQASLTRQTAQQIVVAGALLIAAMFFLTVADLGWLHRRLYATVPGTLAALAAVAVLFVAEF
jgi:type II secretory pathway pseudopilin PulG